MSLKSNFGKKLMAEKRPCDSVFGWWSKQLLIVVLSGLVIYEVASGFMPSSAFGANAYAADIAIIIVVAIMAIIVVFEILSRMMKKGSSVESY